MQYLKSKSCEFAAVDARRKKHIPYRVQSILQSPLLRLATDKFLNDLQLVLSAGLESAGVVEYITVVVCENDFVVDVMHATL